MPIPSFTQAGVEPPESIAAPVIVYEVWFIVSPAIGDVRVVTGAVASTSGLATTSILGKELIIVKAPPALDLAETEIVYDPPLPTAGGVKAPDAPPPEP